MVVELETGGFGYTRPLWWEMGIHLALESILVGKTNTKMFVDDAAALGLKRVVDYPVLVVDAR